MYHSLFRPLSKTPFRNPSRIRKRFILTPHSSSPMITVDSALKKIPLFQNAKEGELTSQILPGGWTNWNYRITYEKDYVLRIPNTDSQKHIDRAIEAQNISFAASLGIAQENTFYEGSTGVQLRPFIEGTILYEQLGQLPETLITKIAQTLSTLHRSKEAFVNTADQFSVIDQYKKLIEEKGATLSEKHNDLYRNIIEIKNKIQKISVKLVPCHNDPNLANFILTPENQLLLMDWEYAANGDPAWDLAYVSHYGSFTDAEDKFLIQAYQPLLEADPSFIDRMEVYKPVSEFMLALWIRLQIVNGHFPISQAEWEEEERISLENVEKILSESAFQSAFNALSQASQSLKP